MYLLTFINHVTPHVSYSAKRFDEAIREKIRQANDTGIFPNRLNSESKWLHKNQLCKGGKMCQASGRRTMINQYDTIQAELEAELANRKESAEKTKSLKEQLAALKASGTTYRSRRKGAKRGLQYHPEAEDVDDNLVVRGTGNLGFYFTLYKLTFCYIQTLQN